MGATHPACKKVFRRKRCGVGKLLIYKIGHLVLGDSSDGNRCNQAVDADFYQQPETVLKAPFGLL